MTNTLSISSKPENKSCADKLNNLKAIYTANDTNTDSTCEQELTFSMDNIYLFNEAIEKLISALDRLKNEEQRIPLEMVSENK
jgi:hypothetical protein